MAQLHVLKDADAAEWALRVDLAATFRLSAREKWNEGFGNHNSAMIPDTETMRINPLGMIVHDSRARDLLVCDLRGKAVHGNASFRTLAHHCSASVRVIYPKPCVL